MKKMINNPDNVVDEMLRGMVAAHPDYVKRVDGCDVLVRANGSQGKVVLVSGGGSGHEPAHGGYGGCSSCRSNVYFPDTGSGL